MRILPLVFNNADTALANADTASRHDDLLNILSDAPVPSYPGKSVAQANIDLVHPIVNAIYDFFFTLMGWTPQSPLSSLSPALAGDEESFDFTYKLPNGKYIAVEIQLGNGGRLKADFDKLSRLHELGLLEIGYLVYFDKTTAKTADRGVATFEKAVTAVKRLKDVPACIIGLSRFGAEVETVNLQAIRGVPFPTVFGGTGEQKEELFEWVAEAIASRRNLAELKMPAKLRKVVVACSHAAVDKSMALLHSTVDRVLACDDEPLRRQLLAKVTAHALSSTTRLAAAMPKRKLRMPAPAAPAAEPVSTVVVESKLDVPVPGPHSVTFSATAPSRTNSPQAPATTASADPSPYTNFGVAPAQAPAPARQLRRVTRAEVEAQRPKTPVQRWVPANEPFICKGTAMGAAFARLMAR